MGCYDGGLLQSVFWAGSNKVYVINIWKFNKVGEIGADFSQAPPCPLSLKI